MVTLVRTHNWHMHNHDDEDDHDGRAQSNVTNGQCSTINNSFQCLDRPITLDSRCNVAVNIDSHRHGHSIEPIDSTTDSIGPESGHTSQRIKSKQSG